MTENEIEDLQERLAVQLSAGEITRHEAEAALVAAGFSEALAVDYVTLLTEGRAE